MFYPFNTCFDFYLFNFYSYIYICIQMYSPIYEGCSESNVSYFPMLACDIRGRWLNLPTNSPFHVVAV